MLLDAVDSAETFVNAFVAVYWIALFAYLLTTWVQLPYSLRPIQRFLADVCDPYLRFWRRVVPLRAGPLDFSGMVGLLALIVLDRIVLAVLERLH